MGQILRYTLKPPRQPKEKDDMHFLATDFINSVRKVFKTAGYLQRNGEGQECGGRFLLGYKAKLYIVASDFQIGYSLKPYQAVGCGDDIALGALYATEALAAGGFGPKERVEMALRAAAHFSGGVSAPFTVLSI
jgi:hypothetical protein